MGIQAGRQQLADWGSHILVWISTWGARQTTQPRVSVWGNNASNLWLKTPVEVEAAAGETPSLTREFVGDTHRGLESTQTHPLGNQHQKGPLCLWVAGEVTESWQRAEQVQLFPLRSLPHIQYHSSASVVALPG